MATPTVQHAHLAATSNNNNNKRPLMTRIKSSFISSSNTSSASSSDDDESDNSASPSGSGNSSDGEPADNAFKKRTKLPQCWGHRGVSIHSHARRITHLPCVCPPFAWLLVAYKGHVALYIPPPSASRYRTSCLYSADNPYAGCKMLMMVYLLFDFSITFLSHFDFPQ